ncbi:MAG TPA: SMP-30/gluconolactonase/LRE family protein [Ilumatobacteraceae bacterium]|nr:SMP-30/gluconolactonase/LRE family protein [Ilumatobacteraceae bacterium]
MTGTFEVRPLVMGKLHYAEGLRWHDGKLWLSDLFGRAVYTIDGDRLDLQATLPDDEPSGLGFLPSGAPIVVAMKSRQLRSIAGGEVSLYADMSVASRSECNDMLVDGQGRAYVSNFGYDLRSGEEPKPGELILVRPGEPAVVAVGDLIFPDGMVLSPDGRTLIVAQLFGEELTAYDVADDGSLSGRRTFAHLPGIAPDGLAIDAEGAVWVSGSTGCDYLRVLDGGEITHRIAIDGQWTPSCALGGDDGRTLFMVSAETTLDEWMAGKSVSHIRTARVDVPAASY